MAKLAKGRAVVVAIDLAEEEAWIGEVEAAEVSSHLDLAKHRIAVDLRVVLICILVVG